MENKNCTKCHKEFEPRSNCQKYCSECSEFIIKKAKREFIRNKRKQKNIDEKVNKQINDYNARLARKLFPKEETEDDFIKRIVEINKIPPLKEEDHYQP